MPDTDTRPVPFGRNERWIHERPHMLAIDAQLARQIVYEVESVFGVERETLLAKNLKFNEARYAAMELFPWSTVTTAEYFRVTVNSVSWARLQVQLWSDVYPVLKAKMESVRERLKLPTFARYERRMSKRAAKLISFCTSFYEGEQVEQTSTRKRGMPRKPRPPMTDREKAFLAQLETPMFNRRARRILRRELSATQS